MTTGRTRLEVILELKDKFSAKLRKSSKGLDGFSKKLKSIRGPLLAISAGLIGVGAVATKAFFSFDTELQRIVGLVGVAQSEVDQMRKGVLALSGATAIAPAELAAALFAVTSAGQRGDEAMETLKVSARAAAAGMGETKSVALALVGALQSYGSAGLKAADATDILVATVRAGNLEADTLASQLARIVPIASNAGVSLEQLGGAIALITRTGASTAETVTGLRAAIIAIAAPTTEALSTFNDMGVSAEDLQTALSEKGLVAALRLVRRAAGDNETLFRKMIGSIEGVTAANVLINASNADLEQTFGQVADAAGVTNEAFGIAAATAEFQFRQAIVDLKIAFVEMGAVVGPIVVDITEKMSGLAKVFANLPDLTQKTAIGFGAIVAAVALLGLALPVLITGFGFLTAEIALFAAAAAGAVAIGFLLGATVEGIINGIKKITTDPGSKAAINPIAILKNEMQFLRDAILGVSDALSADELKAEALRAPFLAAAKEVEDLAKAAASNDPGSLTTSFKEFGTVAVEAMLAVKGATRELFEFLEAKGARNVQDVIDHNREMAATNAEAAAMRMALEQEVLDFETRIRDIRIFEHNEENRQIVEGARQRVDDLIAEQDRLEADRRRRVAEAEEAVRALGTTGGFGANVAGFRSAFAEAMARRRERLLAGEDVAPLPQGLIDLFIAQGPGALFPIGASAAALPGFSASVEVRVILFPGEDVFNQAVAVAIASNEQNGA